VKDCITWVGMDDSANKINVAVLHGLEEQIREEFVVTNDDSGMGRLAKRLKGLPGEVHCVYEAGTNGYHIHRFLKKHKLRCDVAAPSLTPRRAGQRVKTDRLDAKRLAFLHRAGQLTRITIPEKEQESLRDLLRAREDALEDLQRARHRLSRFVLRRGLKYRTGKAWSRGHLQWIKALRFEDAQDRMVVEEYRLALDEEMDRLHRYDEKVEELAQQPPYKKHVSYLMALKGIQTLTAMTILAEALDLRRFVDAPAFMSGIGVVGSEYSSGDKEQRGCITKTGNAHMRRVIIESAWHYRHGAVAGKALKKRREGLPAEVIEIARKADRRLNKKYWHLVNRGKRTQAAAVAVARELAGFIWAIGQVA
jgi:transposase